MKKIKVMNPDGEMRDVNEDKLHLAAKDDFLPVVSNGQENRRVSASKIDRAMADGFKPFYDLASDGEALATKMADIKEGQTPIGVAARSVGRGLTADLLDEAVGAAGGMWDDAKSLFTGETNRGVKPTFDQYGNVSNSKELAGAYREARDEERLKQKVDDINHPVATTVGKIGGGVVSGAMLPGSSTFTGSVGYGALQGAGASEEEDLAGIAKDASIGGAFGAAGYGAGKAMLATPGLVKDGVKKAGPAVKAGAQAITKGGSFGEDAIDAAMISSGLPPVNRLWRGVKAGWNESKAVAAARGEYDEVMEGLSKTFGPGTATNLSDNDILMQKLLQEGIAGEPNQAHKLVASKFASAHGGDSNQYLSLLKRSPEELANAQGFNPIAASEELAPAVQDAFDSVRSASAKQYGALKEQARNQFQLTSDPIAILDDALVGANRYRTISTNTRAALQDVLDDVAGREGEKSFAELSSKEQFDRILDAKQRIGKAVKWANQHELPEGQKILQDTYGKFQTMLQSLDDMAAADKGYSGFKQLENSLFKKLGTVERGKIKEFDPIKMESLFSGTKTGRQLMVQVQKAKQMLDDGMLPPESAANVQKLLDKIDEMASKASLKREMNAFRYGDAGPSSPAIQRMSAISGKDSATTTAVRAPQLFLKMKAAASNAAQGMYGKSFSKLNPEEQKVVSKFALWIAQNDGADPTTMTRMMESFKNPKFKP
ncbi:MAG TPA: hypothetical protein V6C65_38870 [Allocoleopsis sp.]